MIPRLYQACELTVGQTHRLVENAHHHLSRVLRRKPQDKMILFNGQGGEYRGEITDVLRKETIVLIHEFINKNIESPLNLHLGQGITRGEKMDMMLQKAVELGVREITPVITEKCAVKFQQIERRISHWEKVIISACEQSGRTYLPILHEATTYSHWIQQGEDPGILFDPSGDNTIDKISSPRTCALLGPEAGFSQGEIEQAKALSWKIVNLGPRILRAETATVAALAALQLQWGDF